MKIEICDICKKIPETDFVICRMAIFEAKEDLFGIPRKKIVICQNCYDKLFNSPLNNSKE